MIKQYLKLGLILAAFSVVACVALAFVYGATSEKIAAQAGIQLKASLASLFPDADDFKDIGAELPALSGDTKLVSAYAATKAGKTLGVAVKATGPSYGGPSVILVGLGPDKNLTGVRILESKDTPGLGLNATNASYFVNKAKKLTFPGQFTGKALSDGFVVKKDVDAITASTITSKALTVIIKASADSASAWLDAKGEK